MPPFGSEGASSSCAPYRFSRRTLLASVPGLMLIVAGVACGGDDDDEPASAATTSGRSGGAASPTTVGSASTPTLATAVSTATTGASPVAPDGEWTFTDDRGVTITLPQAPQRIVAQTTSAAVLWDFGIRPVGVFGPSKLPDGTNDFQAGDIDFDSVEIVGDYGTLDLEKLVALDADLYVDLTFGGDTLWYLTEDELGQVEAIVPTLGISMQKISVLEAIGRFEELAASLGVDVESPELKAVKTEFDAAEADLKAAIAEKPGLKVLVVSPAVDTLYVASPEWMVDLRYFRDLGLDIVTPETSVDGFWELLSWEQANKYPADLILVDARIYAASLDEYSGIATWQSLPAIAADQIGPWYAGAPYSYARLAPMMLELAGIIRDADADLV
jgi:iron complex transport system substrate-binding protein